MKSILTILLFACLSAGAKTYYISGPDTVITLNGSKSYDSLGLKISYKWTQIGGVAVPITKDTSVFAVIRVAPGAYIFRLTGTNSAGLTRFDDVAVNVVQAIVLPVKFQSFTDSSYGTMNKLKWVMADESTVFSYAIQKSTDGKSYTTIATIRPTNPPNGYSYTDDGKKVAIVYYRIAVTEQSGKVTYSTYLTVKYTVPPPPPPVKKCHKFLWWTWCN